MQIGFKQPAWIIYEKMIPNSQTTSVKRTKRQDLDQI